jgi:hypothetical protein
MKKINIVLIFITTISILSCNAQKNYRGANYTYEVSCLGSELDGSITVESYGMGRNYSDASEQAKKNAAMAVIFKGIKIGVGDCNKSPLVLSSDAQNKYEEYFGVFFKDNGPYMQYVSLKDERIGNKVKRNVKKSEDMQQRKVIVRVDRLGLKKKLKEDNIN